MPSHAASSTSSPLYGRSRPKNSATGRPSSTAASSRGSAPVTLRRPVNAAWGITVTFAGFDAELVDRAAAAVLAVDDDRVDAPV